jgi:tetratricopeptide (TPR) repeat protein
MRKRILAIVLLVVIVGVALPTGVVVIRAQSGFSAAQGLLAYQLWPQARERLASYLWLHPHDGQARLLMAEAFAKDDALPSDEAASQAIDCLAQIPDSSPLAAEARLRQGALCFLVLQKPGRAEQLVRKSLELKLSGDFPSYQLLWTLLNFTGRSDDTEEIFWRVYELSSDDQRPFVLREWYMNQFFPLTANEPLDRRMGILAPDEEATRTTESRRYVRFREREPDAVVNHVAVAQWFQVERDPEFAARLLDAAAKEFPAATSDPFFLSVSIATQLDLGQFEAAHASFRQWPENDRGHAYWKWRAIILDDALGQYQEALAAYDRALSLWPGPADWRLRHRQAGCLARLRRPEESAAMIDRIGRLKELMSVESHERLRTALGSLDDPEQLIVVADFYRQLGRDREADCWKEHIQRLQARVAKSQ